MYCSFSQSLLPGAVQVQNLAKKCMKGVGFMKILLKWVKAIELNLLFVTFVFEMPNSETIARVSGKENNNSTLIDLGSHDLYKLYSFIINCFINRLRVTYQ